ncbi:MAG: hypothetical protein R2713_22115 [Ilumatobacteraceae bacterium]
MTFWKKRSTSSRFPPAVDHHRHGTEVHAVRGHEQQVAAHPVELGQQHPHPHRALGDVVFDPEELLGGEREDELVVERAEVVHAGDVGAALQIGELLAGLLHAGVQVADDRLAAQHGLTLELEHQPQHAVRARVLGPHVDDHRLILGGIDGEVAELGGLGLAEAQHGADLAQQLARGEFGTWLEALLGLVALFDRVEDAHQFGAPLNCTGIRPTS